LTTVEQRGLSKQFSAGTGGARRFTIPEEHAFAWVASFGQENRKNWRYDKIKPTFNTDSLATR